MTSPLTSQKDLDGKPSTALANTSEAQSQPFTAACVIGLGLIGGSIAATLARLFPQMHRVGVEVEPLSREEAVRRGWVNEAFDPSDEALAAFLADECDLVILATPVAATDSYLAYLGESGYRGLITDTISTKSHILAAANELLSFPEKYIPGHPMTGSEKSGINAARDDLFEGINWILCPDETTDPEDFRRLHELIIGMQARVVSLRREEHDKAMAIVSHVPHMVASSLVQLACRHTDASRSLMRLAAGGFKDTTRIAAGSPDLWCGIAFDNADALHDGLAEMVSIIESFDDALTARDGATFTALLAQAASARRALPAAWVPSTDNLLEVRIPMVNRNGVVAEVTTIASSAGCNIQSIDIDHISEGNAVLSLILTDEGDVGKLSVDLIKAGYSVSLSPLMPEE